VNRWPRRTLGELTSTITKGTTPQTLGRQYSPEGVPFLRAENLQGGSVFVDSETLRIDTETHRLLVRSVIRPNDVLLSIAGTIGRAGIVSDDAPEMNCNQAVAIIRLDPGQILPAFLLLWLKTSEAQSQMSGAQVTQTVSNLSLGQIKTLRPPVPSLAEQERIVKLLAEVDELRKLRAQADRRTADLIPALFHDMFGDPVTNPRRWRKTDLGQLCTLVNGAPFKPSDWNGSGLPIVRIQNLNDSTKPFNYTSKELPEKFRVRPGDILLSWSGTPGTSFGCFHWKGPEGWLNQHIFNVKLQPGLDREFFIQSVNVRLNDLIARAHGGVGLQHVTKGVLNAVPVLVPPLPMQQEFAKRVAETRELEAEQAASRERLDALFQSMLHRAFRGEL